jgi:hypothetical protein
MVTMELTKKDIIYILSLINDELVQAELSATALVYGGCALILHGYDTRATVDIDYIVTDITMADYSEILDRVVERSELPLQRSLFDVTMGPLIANHFKKNEMCELNLFSNLNVAIASAKQLLAMKLFSARMGNEFHDISDAIYLANELGISTTAELKDTLLTYVEEASVHKVNRNPRNPGAIDFFISEVEKRLIK